MNTITPVIDKKSAAEQFMHDWCAFGNENHDMRPGCDPELFLDWNCCEFHRNASIRLAALSERAKGLLVIPNVAEMCAYWGVILCETYGLDFMSFKLMPWLSEIGGALWRDRGHR